MDEEERKRCASRLRTALELADSGIALQRAKLRRQNPDASDEEISQMLREWLHHRPGAEHGDAVGSVVELPLERS
jgi:hypothetical protein